jgi:exosome complex component CSL4
MVSDILLPGQLLSLPRGPVPKLGGGLYLKDGQVRASLVGVAQYEGSVG